MKKLVAGMLCATLALSMVGCSKGDSNKVLSQVEENKVLKVAVSPDYAPYEFEDPSKSGQEAYAGADIEFARYAAEQMGVELEIVPMDFEACLAAVTQGKVDCSISGFYPSEERRKTVDFSDAYFDDAKQQIVILKENAEKYSTQESFKGEKVAAQNGSVQQTIVTDNMPDSTLQLVTKTSDGIQMVRSGKVAGIVLQGVMADSVIKSDDSLTISKVEYIYDESELVVAMAKGEDDLKAKFNEIIATVNEEKLYDQWIVKAQELASTIKE